MSDAPKTAAQTAPSRTEHSARNAMTSVICQGVTMLLAFMGQWVFLHTLNVEYLGIASWFTSILSVLAISELGIGSAMVVSLYKPLAAGDEPRIQASIRLLRRAYRYVGLTVLILGLSLLPFLPQLVNQETDLVDLRLVYGLYLAQSVSSYLFCSYKTAIFTADQRQSQVHFWSLIASIFTTAAQMTVLVLWRSYYAYVGIFTLSVILKNLLIARSADKRYPYLRNVAKKHAGDRDEEYLPKAERKSIFRNLFGLSMYRISGTVLTATDALVLGKFRDFAIMGLYKNYLLVVTAVTTVLTLLFQSFTASVGHLNVTADPKRKQFVFRCLNLLDGWLYGFSAVCLFVLLDPFIGLYFGESFVFTEPFIVPAIVLNFLTSGLLENVIMHKDACGLFWQGRFRPVFSAGLKIALSIWWVGPFGITGVLMASVVSRLMTTWWFDPWMVHHYALQSGVKGYAVQTGLFLALTAFCCAAVKGLVLWLFPVVHLGNFLVMLLLCAVVPNGVFWLAFRRREEFAYLKEQGIRLWQKIRAGAIQ